MGSLPIGEAAHVMTAAAITTARISPNLSPNLNAIPDPLAILRLPCARPMRRSLGAELAAACELLHARKKNCSKDFDMHTPDVRAAARALGGDIVGRDQVLCPGPGHSPRDRSLAVRFVADGFIVHSHAKDDWQTCRDHVSARLGWDNQRPVTKPARMRATPQPPDDTVDRIGWARSLWRAVPAKGTLAERYLVETRRLAFQTTRQSGCRYSVAATLSRPQEHPAYGSIQRTFSRAVSRFLEGLGNVWLIRGGHLSGM
jgi:hypothetical protein